MTLEWILSEIKDLEHAPNAAKNVYDLAALIVVRNYLLEEKTESISLPENSRPVSPIDTVEAALGNIMISSEDEKKRAQDAKTWLKIICGES